MPPVDQVSVQIELSTLIVETVSDFVPDDPAYTKITS
jgi:hypothetical protein